MLIGSVFAAKEVVEATGDGAYDNRTKEVRNRRHSLQIEMKTLQGLRHERIVQYVDWYEDVKDHWILVIEYCQYGSLDILISTATAPFAAREIAEILKQAAEGLLYLHGQGVTHRDVKPANILVRNRSPLSLALSDFGVANVGNGSHMETNCGTWTYMAFETWGENSYTRAVDIWALGVVGFELLNNGIPPLDKSRQSRYCELIFDEIAAMHNRNPGNRLVANVRRMLAWDPRDRPAADECIDDANDILDPSRPTEPFIPSASVKSQTKLSTATLRSSEIRSCEKHFQTTGWRAAHAATTVPPKQQTKQQKITNASSQSNPPATALYNPTHKRGTDALPRSNSMEAPSHKMARTAGPHQTQHKGPGAQSRPANTPRAAGQQPTQTKSSSALPRPNSSGAPKQQPTPSQAKSTGAPSQPNSPSTTICNGASPANTPRKLLAASGVKGQQQHPVAKPSTTGNSPPRATNSSNTAGAVGHDPTQERDAGGAIRPRAQPPRQNSTQKGSTGGPPSVSGSKSTAASKTAA